MPDPLVRGWMEAWKAEVAESEHWRRVATRLALAIRSHGPFMDDACKAALASYDEALTAQYDGSAMLDISNYAALSNDQLADILETLGTGQISESRGILLLEAARRLRGPKDGAHRKKTESNG